MTNKYDKLCHILDLYKSEDSEDSINHDLRMTVKKHYDENPEGFLMLGSDDFSDRDSCIVSIAMGCRDDDFIMIIADDCGHLHIIENREDAEDFVESVSDGFIGMPSEFSTNLQKVIDKYSTNGTKPVDYYAMAKRLIELGDL